MHADTALDWMRAHVRTLFVLDPDGRITTVNEPGGAAGPRFFFGRTAEGWEAWFRDDVPPETIERLRAACAEAGSIAPSVPLPDVTSFERILARDAPVERIWSGPAYRFPDEPGEAAEIVLLHEGDEHVLAELFPDWLEDVTACQPFAAMIREGRAVSLCATVRRTDAAAQAGVETHPAHRGQGLAGRAVIAWAHAVRAGGRAPLYSTSWENEASLKVAAKLGLIRFGSDLHIT